MLTKAQFALLMTKWQIAEEKIERANELVYQMFGGSVDEITNELEELVCDVMRVAMDDKQEWIPYFAFERGFDLSQPCVYEADGAVTPTETWVDVYRLIVESHDPEDQELDWDDHETDWSDDDDADWDEDGGLHV